jgi:nitrogen fixation/metabolism regulation signal transduction histidine kinase
MDDRAQALQEIDKLRLQISFLKALPNASPIGLLVVDHRKKDEIHYFNEAFLSMWKAGHLKEKVSKDEVDYGEIMVHLANQAADPGTFTAYCRQIRVSDELQVRDHILKLSDGRHICFHSNLIFDSDSQYQGRLYAFEDVTKIVKAEEDVRKSNEQYRELSDLLPQIVFEMDTRGNLTFINRSAYEVMGYSDQDFVLGLNVLAMVAPEDRERARQNIQSVLNGE